MANINNYSVESNINFYYFLNNYNYNFIEEIWGEDTSLGKHFRSKFEGNILRFIGELSEDNKEKLMEWVENNYTSSREFGKLRLQHKLRNVMLWNSKFCGELLEDYITVEFLEGLEIDSILATEETLYFDIEEIIDLKIDTEILLEQFKAYKKTL